MRNYKKFLSGMLCVAMVVSLCACGKKKKDTTDELIATTIATASDAEEIVEDVVEISVTEPTGGEELYSNNLYIRKRGTDFELSLSLMDVMPYTQYVDYSDSYMHFEEIETEEFDNAYGGKSEMHVYHATSIPGESDFVEDIDEYWIDVVCEMPELNKVAFMSAQSLPAVTGADYREFATGELFNIRAYTKEGLPLFAGSSTKCSLAGKWYIETTPKGEISYLSPVETYVNGAYVTVSSCQEELLGMDELGVAPETVTNDKGVSFKRYIFGVSTFSDAEFEDSFDYAPTIYYTTKLSNGYELIFTVFATEKLASADEYDSVVNSDVWHIEE